MENFNTGKAKQCFTYLHKYGADPKSETHLMFIVASIFSSFPNFFFAPCVFLQQKTPEGNKPLGRPRNIWADGF